MRKTIQLTAVLALAVLSAAAHSVPLIIQFDVTGLSPPGPATGLTSNVSGNGTAIFEVDSGAGCFPNFPGGLICPDAFIALTSLSASIVIAPSGGPKIADTLNLQGDATSSFLRSFPSQLLPINFIDGSGGIANSTSDNLFGVDVVLAAFQFGFVGQASSPTEDVSGILNSADLSAGDTFVQFDLAALTEGFVPGDESLVGEITAIELVPVPAAVWLLVSALGLLAVGERRGSSQAMTQAAASSAASARR